MENHVSFHVNGMDCAEEVTALQKELSPIVGGPSFLAFDLLNSRLTVRKSKEDLDPGAIIAAVGRAGLTASLWTPQRQNVEEPSWAAKHLRKMLTILSAALILSALGAHAYLHGSLSDALIAGDGGEKHVFPLSVIALYAFSIIAGAWVVFPKALRSARRLQPDMNLLMTVAVIGAVILGEWLEAATVTFLFSLSLLLESWSVDRARRATQKLLELAPALARVIRPDGKEESVPAESISIGSQFLVKPGEKIPLDGRVLRGASEVNQAPITGESLPVAKEPGNQVFSGTINGNGAMVVECTKTAEQSTLASIIRLVSEAHQKRAPSEQWVERFARVYTPAVILLALSALLVPPLFFSGEWTAWLYRSLVFLVIACPCALVISTPVSIVAALAAAARKGILIKGGKFVELPATLKAIAFDKTGTLTRGQLSVARIYPMNEHTEEDLLAIAAAIEARSEHPIARAILSQAKERKVQYSPAEDYQTVQGKGARATIGGKSYWLGSHRYMEEMGQETQKVHSKLVELAERGFTVVAIGNDTHVCGFIAVSDTLRPEARTLVTELRSAGVEHVCMLTGDNQGTAQAIATKVGISEYFAELLPHDKVTKIAELVDRYQRVAMVGDGVNDSPSMARSSLGIAMGAAGSDAAIETADIALMTDDLTRIPWLIRHSRRTLFIIRTNIAFSIAVKAAFMVLTLSGHSSLWAAIAADTGASLLVVFNGLRLLR